MGSTGGLFLEKFLKKVYLLVLLAFLGNPVNIFASNSKSIPNIFVVPGGQSIGVKVKTNGVLVVGRYFKSANDIKVGDTLLFLNNKKINNIKDVENEMKNLRSKSTKKAIKIKLVREGKLKTVDFKPYYDKKVKQVKLGLYIRDSAAGIGTLTFYDPVKKIYGALGHVIADVDTGKPLIIKGGQVYNSNITSIQKGLAGNPGEKRAFFEKKSFGNVVKNTIFGIFGYLNKIPGSNFKEMPIGFSDSVKLGPAKILTVVEGKKVEMFDIKILNILKQKTPLTKGLVIKVTDPKLLKKTGGIIQGMSGSPIIQNGELIGAVTHVFVNDPSTGYGTFIEWMLNEAKVLAQNKKAA